MARECYGARIFEKHYTWRLFRDIECRKKPAIDHGKKGYKTNATDEPEIIKTKFADSNIDHPQLNTQLNSELSVSPLKLNTYIQNVHSIRDKVDELRLTTKSCPFQIIALFETWLTSSITDTEHFNKRYNVYRGDRTENTSDKTDGGGVLIAIESKFRTEKLN